MIQIDQNLNKLAAILLAKSVSDLNSGVLFGDYSLIEEGFCYSFKSTTPISTKDFPKILKQMRKNIDRAYEIKYEHVTKVEAEKLFANQPFKLELIGHHGKDQISIIRFGKDYVDLCEPLEINKLSDLKAIELLNVAGMYWNAKADNEQLTAIYGVAFRDVKDLESFKQALVERKERDHRKIGADLELFTFNILAGQGLPI
jgi:threonyl-tRNA synthetase